MHSQRLGSFTHAFTRWLVHGQLLSDFRGKLLNILARLKQCRKTEMPDVDDLQGYLFDIRLLLFPPLVTIMLDELTAFDPGGAIPLKVLLDPVLMNPGIHTILHGEHVNQCLLQAFTPS